MEHRIPADRQCFNVCCHYFMDMHHLLSEINNDFFESYSQKDLEEMVENGVLDNDTVKRKWLGYPPATTDQIRNRERFLGVTLPASYREFLLTSNGFKNVSFFLNNLFPIDKIDWAKNTEQEWWLELIDDTSSEISDEQYLIYGKEQSTLYYRRHYLKESLKVSEWYDGMCVFLNPSIQHEREWEVLVYATWYPGIARYRSFKEYLIATHEINVGLNSDR